jgi:hypothetical protein
VSYNNGAFIGAVEIVDDAGGGAVPEPSTYALMLGGLGMLVVFTRRRRVV